MAYLILISGAMLLITLGNFLASDARTPLLFGTLLLDVALGVVAVVVIDAILAAAVRALPERWFAPAKRAFTVKEGERRLYRKLGLNSWKKYVPELGCFTGFHKDHLRDPASSEYVGRFLLESHYGVVGHLLGAVLGFLILLLPFLRPWAMALPIAIVNCVLNLLPTMILRYNTPPLLRLYRRNLAKEEKRAEQESVPVSHS